MTTNSRRNTKVKVNLAPNWLMLLGCVLVLLKLLEYGAIADLSWWFVLMPFYIGLAILFAIPVFLACLAGVAYVLLKIFEPIENLYRKYKRKKQNEKLLKLRS